MSLWPSADVRVDVDQFEAAARHALSSGDPAACAAVVTRFGRDLLPDERYEE